jgi:hypothetical protein
MGVTEYAFLARKIFFWIYVARRVVRVGEKLPARARRARRSG